ncbi:APC family permease [Lachnospiraceae bacterium 42-17]|jgi:APA family basic amino acid/polyamine antiporter|nr:APC family permease [Dorea sp.]
MSNNNNQGGSLGLWTCVAMIAGGMIGSAIFSLSGLTIFQAGPSAVITWVIAAVIMLGYGLICAELSTRFPKSGGVFVFPSKSLGKTEKEGKLWGWISTWGYINANIIAIAFAAIYVGTYLSVGFPVFANMQVPLAVISVLFVLILNSLKFSLTGKVNNLLVLGLAVSMIIYIAVAFGSGAWEAEAMTPFFTQGAGGSTGFLSMVPTAMVAYGSIVAMAFMVSEVKDPNRNVPKSILIAMAIVLALYLGIIIATLGMVSAGFLAENPGMQFIPLYAAAFTKLAAYPWISKVISLAALFALLTTMLTVVSLTSRAIQASALQGVMPKKLGENNKAGVPVYAAILVAVPSMIISCFPQFTSIIVGFAALFAAVTISINCVSLIVARKKFALEEGAFKAPGGNALPVIAMILIVICYIPDIISGGWIIWAYTIVWYVIGIIFYKVRTKNQ